MKMYTPKFFTLRELIASATAVKLKIDNVPSFEVVANLNTLCRLILDPAREALGRPIRVTSGYRRAALNKAVGGVNNSQHMLGCAADLQCYDLPRLFDILKTNPHVDQLLYEHRGGISWLHVSISPTGKPRHYINNNYISK